MPSIYAGSVLFASIYGKRVESSKPIWTDLNPSPVSPGTPAAWGPAGSMCGIAMLRQLPLCFERLMLRESFLEE